EGCIADAEACADNGLVSQTVGYAESRGKVLVAGVESQVHRILAVARNQQVIGRRSLFRKAAFEMRCRRGIDLPSHAEIQRQLRRNLPVVRDVREDLRLP